MLNSQNIVSNGRKSFILYFTILLFVVLILRLYQLQIIRYSKFVDFSDANRIRIVPIEAPRGIIYDRNGEIIVSNESQYNVSIIPFESGSSDSIYSFLGEVLNSEKEKIVNQVRSYSRGEFIPYCIARDISFEQLVRLEENKLDLPGVLFSIEPVRSFTPRASLAQTLGYLREVGKEDLENVKKYGYRMGDLIGWKGLEREYEQVVRGTRGFKYLQVDVYGREVGEVQERSKIAPKSGHDLYLSIDLDLQVLCESLMKGKKGAIVCLDADNGEILSLVSKPDYSPEIFSGVIEPKLWRSMRDDSDRPLYNRVTQGTYAPGSTFKIITAIAAMEEGIVDTNWTVRCRGTYRLGKRTFRCWNRYGHGRMDMKNAIINSCNIYFYSLIRKMDLDIWADYARLFRFGSLTGIDLPQESVGIVPDKQFLDNKFGAHGWTEGLKLNLVLGQGDLLVTPLQMARFASTIANEGTIVQPHLGLKYYDKVANQFVPFTTNTDSITTISDRSWDFIQRAMYSVVNSRSGTGRGARVKGCKVYGKTGTSQNPHGEDHSWFIGFMKNGTKSMSLAVLVEHGGTGGKIAAPIAGKIFKFYNEKCKDINLVYQNE